MSMKICMVLAAAFAISASAAEMAHAGYKPHESYERYDRYDRGGDIPFLSRRRERSIPCKRDCAGAYRYVYAESWYGFKKVIAPVRRAEFGDQVRLPGGTWVYCEYSCEYTLRKQSLDFWEGQGQGFVSPGRFRWDLYLDRY